MQLSTTKTNGSCLMENCNFTLTMSSSENRTQAFARINVVYLTFFADFQYKQNGLGPQSKIQRRLCMNSVQELMVCWWQFGPWLQTAREHERVNVVLLRCSFGRSVYFLKHF